MTRLISKSVTDDDDDDDDPSFK